MKLIIITIILTALTSCINKKLIHGNLPSADLVSIIKLGKDNKESISKILGEPSFKGTLGDNSFYYLGRVNSQIAFLKPDLEQQIILELNFDNQGRYSGKYLCNNIFGNYQINDSGNIKMDFPASTKMFCFPPSEDVETNTDLMIEFISNNEMELKSNDGSTDEIYFESGGNKLFFQIVN